MSRCTAQSWLGQTRACVRHLSNKFYVQTKTNKNRMQEKGCSNGNKSEIWRLQSASSCMTNLECDQLLPTASEQFWSHYDTSLLLDLNASHILLLSVCYRSILWLLLHKIPVLFPRYHLPGYEATNFTWIWKWAWCGQQSRLNNL